MNRLLLTMLAGTAALAAMPANGADLGVPYRAPLAAPPVFSWTGCYAGTRSGLGTGHTTMQDKDVPGDIDAFGGFRTANTDMSGGTIGGQLGCDYQIGPNYVIGLQAMVDYSSITGTNMDQFNSTWTLRDRVDWFGSTTARLGWTYDRFLVYGKGGFAWGHNKFEIENSGATLGTPQATRLGWTLGSGLEFAFAPSWSVFVETNYYNFGNQSVPFIGNAVVGNGPFHVNTSQTLETFEIGLNYHFWGR